MENKTFISHGPQEQGLQQGNLMSWPLAGVIEILLLSIVSIVVPFFGLTKSIFRIRKGNPKKELQWRL